MSSLGEAPSAESLRRLKIFPLPTAVLLPGAVLPLHIFEPRYRKMVADALEGDRLIAMALLDGSWEREYHARPPVRPMVGVGRILEEQRLPDGRYNLQLAGVARAQIVTELETDEPYRLVEAVLPEEAQPVADAAESSLRLAVLELCRKLPGDAAEGLARGASAMKTPGELADLCIAALAVEAKVRQRALELLDVAERLRLAFDLTGESLAALHAAAARKSAPGPLN